jgi:predicted nucleotidyltransferase
MISLKALIKFFRYSVTIGLYEDLPCMVTIEEIKRAGSAVCARNNAVPALLFGSYARGTATERSDIDLIFVENTREPFLKRIDRYFDPLTDALKAPAEIFVYTKEEFIKMKELFFVRRACEEGIILYESGKVPSEIGARA